MLKFFDTIPTTQSRLLTFRCPYYKKDDPDDKHLITIAWKFKDVDKSDEVFLIIENTPYKGKPLAITPQDIEDYEGDFFPLGTFFITCTCIPKKDGKVCYVATDVIDIEKKFSIDDLNAIKVTKKISKDIKVSNQMLIQLYDLLEEIKNNQKKFNEFYVAEIKRFHNIYNKKLENLEKNLNKSFSNFGILISDHILEALSLLDNKVKKFSMNYIEERKIFIEKLSNILSYINLIFIKIIELEKSFSLEKINQNFSFFKEMADSFYSIINRNKEKIEELKNNLQEIENYKNKPLIEDPLYKAALENLKSIENIQNFIENLDIENNLDFFNLERLEEDNYLEDLKKKLHLEIGNEKRKNKENIEKQYKASEKEGYGTVTTLMDSAIMKSIKKESEKVKINEKASKIDEKSVKIDEKSAKIDEKQDKKLEKKQDKEKKKEEKRKYRSSSVTQVIDAAIFKKEIKLPKDMEIESVDE